MAVRIICALVSGSTKPRFASVGPFPNAIEGGTPPSADQTNKNSFNFKDWFKNYNSQWGGLNFSLMNTAIGAGADLAGNLINSNGLSTGVGNLMSGIGNVVGNIPGPIGWAGKGLAFAGQTVNALWGHKFNDANIAAAESANAQRNSWLFGDYSNTDALLAGSASNVLLGNVNKGFIGKEGPFSNAVTNKMKLINNDRMMANLRANNSELNAYNNYLTGSVRLAIAGDTMGTVNAAASGGPLNMINGAMTPFGNRYFADGGYTHGGTFTNGFIEINNGGSHESNPNQGVQYGIDPEGTPNMVEEGETIFDDYVFSKRIKFPKKYKDEFSLGGKIWKKSFADVSKMIAKESEERPNDPISQLSLRALGGKLADIQEEVKAKQALDKMDPREVMAMLQQLGMMQQGGQPQMEEQQMMQDPYQLAMMMEEGLPMMAACGGKLHSYGGNLFKIGGLTNPYVARSDSGAHYANNAFNNMMLHIPRTPGNEIVDAANENVMKRNYAALKRETSTGIRETKSEKRQRLAKNKAEMRSARKQQAALKRVKKNYQKRNHNLHQLWQDNRTESLHKAAQLAFIDNWNILKQADAENKASQVFDYMIGSLFPSNIYGAVAKAVNEGSGAYGALDHYMRRDTKGYLSTTKGTEEWAEKHPTATGAINLLGDIVLPYGLSKTAKMVKNLKFELPFEESQYALIIRDSNPYPEQFPRYSRRSNPSYVGSEAEQLATIGSEDAYTAARRNHLNVSPQLDSSNVRSTSTNASTHTQLPPRTAGLPYNSSGYTNGGSSSYHTSIFDDYVHGGSGIAYDTRNRPIVAQGITEYFNRHGLKSTGNITQDVDAYLEEQRLRQLGLTPPAFPISERAKQTLPHNVIIPAEEADNLIAAGYTKEELARNGILVDAGNKDWYGKEFMRNLSEGSDEYIGLAEASSKILGSNTGSHGSRFWPFSNSIIDGNGQLVINWSNLADNYINFRGDANLKNRLKRMLNMDYPSGTILNESGASHTSATSNPIYTRAVSLLAAKAADRAIVGPLVEEGLLNDLGNVPSRLSLLNSGLLQELAWAAAGANYAEAAKAAQDAVKAGTFSDFEAALNSKPRPKLVIEGDPAVKFTDGSSWSTEEANNWISPDREDATNYLRVVDANGKLVDADKFRLAMPSYDEVIFEHNFNVDKLGKKLSSRQMAEGYDPNIGRWTNTLNRFSPSNFISTRLPKDVRFGSILGPILTGAGVTGLGSVLLGIDQERYSYGGPLNLFKHGSRVRRIVKGKPVKKSKLHKSDVDWEKMYDRGLPIYQKMVNAGVPEWYARGVIYNMAAESSFDPEATNGTHWGYVLNDKTLKNYIEKHYGGHGAEQQLQFLIDGLTGGIKGSKVGLGAKIQKRFDNYIAAMKGVEDPERAAELWERNYEISGGLGMYDRRNYGRKFYDKHNPRTAEVLPQVLPTQSTLQTQQATPQVLNSYPAYEIISNLVPKEVLDYARNFTPTYSNEPDENFTMSNQEYSSLLDNDLEAARNNKGRGRSRSKTNTTTSTTTTTNNTETSDTETSEVAEKPETSTTTTTTGNITDYGFLKSIEGISHLEKLLDKTDFSNQLQVATLLAELMSNKIISKDEAAKLFYNMLNNIFPGMKESGIKTSGEYWKNLLGTKLGGYTKPVLKKDAKGNLLYKETKDKKTGKVIKKEPIMENKKVPWVGPAYYKAMQANPLPSEFNLGRGFTGDYKNLSLKYNADIPETELDKLLRQYGTTDAQILNSYYNQYEDEQKEIWKKKYDQIKEDKKIYDTDEYKNWLAYRSGDTDVLSPEALAIADKAARRHSGVLSGIEGIENEADREAILDMYTEDLYDNGLIGDELLNPYYVASLDSDYDNLYATEAVDPESEAFSKLNPYQQQIAREKYYSNLAKNDKEGAKYFKLFEEEDKKEAERLKRDEELRNSLEYNPLPTWMRYAPLAFSSIATLSDALGLTNKPDFTPYRQLLALSNRLNQTTPVRYHPTFLPLLYLPANLNYDLLLANNMYAAANRNIGNVASGNVGAGIAGNLAALNSAYDNYGKIRQSVNELDIANRRSVMDYNNKGMYSDAMGSMEAQKINAVNAQNAQKFGYQALADALRYYQSEQQASNAAKQVNLTHAVNSWANVGRENMYMNMINANKAWDYKINQDGTTIYKALANALNTLNGL